MLFWPISNLLKLKQKTHTRARIYRFLNPYMTLGDKVKVPRSTSQYRGNLTLHWLKQNTDHYLSKVNRSKRTHIYTHTRTHLK
jgi:hypothetical protein